jgi:hypothetical protein
MATCSIERAGFKDRRILAILVLWFNVDAGDVFDFYIHHHVLGMHLGQLKCKKAAALKDIPFVTDVRSFLWTED